MKRTKKSNGSVSKWIGPLHIFLVLEQLAMLLPIFVASNHPLELFIEVYKHKVSPCTTEYSSVM